MPWPIGCALFGFALATLIVPTGAQLIGRLVEMAGRALQLHGEGLADAYAIYVARWRER